MSLTRPLAGPLASSLSDELNGGADGGSPPEALERLYVSGKDLVSTETGLPVLLRGINWGRWYYFKAGDAALVASWGVNCVRVPLRWDGLYSDPGIDSRLDAAPGHVNPENLALHDEMMDEVEAAGLWAIPFIDSNCGQNGLQSPEDAAYCDPGGLYPNGRNFWRDASARAKFKEVWEFIALRNKHRDRIAMCEILPEPNPDDINDAAVRDFYAELAPVVRGTGINAPLMVGARPGYSINRCDTAFNADESDYVYTGNLFAFTQQTPELNLQGLNDRFQNLLDMRDTRNVPIFVQQWGCRYEDEDAELYLQRRTSNLLNGYTLSTDPVGSTYWEMDDGLVADAYGIYHRPGGIEGARVVKQDRLDMLLTYWAGDEVLGEGAPNPDTWGDLQLLGANVGPTIEYTTRMWVNLANMGRACWCPTTDSSGFGYTSVSLKANGYPASGTTSVRVFMAEVVDWDAGDYLFECTGDLTGDIDALGAWTWQVALSYNAGTNKTTGTLRVPTGQDGTNTLSLRFNSVAADFADLKINAPGYALASTQKIRTEFIAHVSKFDTLRFMDQLNTNGQDGAFPGGGNQDENWTGSYAAAAGDGLQHQHSLAATFEIASECGTNIIWINTPAKATNAYFASYVADAAARRPASALVIAEVGNELWNNNLGESTAYQDIRTAAFTAAGVRAGADFTSISRTSNVVTAEFDTAHGLSTGATIYVRHKTGAFSEGSEVVTVTNATTLTWADSGSDGAISHTDDDTFVFLNPTHTLSRQLTNYHFPEYPTANYVRIRYMLQRARALYDAVVTAGETANIKVALSIWTASSFNYVPCIAWAVEEYGDMDWLYSMPTTMYFEPANPNAITSIADVFSQLDTNATDVIFPNMVRWNNLMHTWGMKCLGYEAGPHTHTADADSDDFVIAAHSDDGMRTRIKAWYQKWRNRGGEQCCFFHAGIAKAPTSPNSTWPITYGDYTDDATSVKNLAFEELLTESALAVAEAGVNSGTILYLDVLPNSTEFLAQAGGGSGWFTMNPAKSVPDVTIGVAVDADGNYDLAIDAARHTDAAVAYEAFVDGVSVSSGNLPSVNVFTTAPTEAFTVEVALTAGYHLVTFHVPNASRADWVGLYRVRLTAA